MESGIQPRTPGNPEGLKQALIPQVGGALKRSLTLVLALLFSAGALFAQGGNPYSTGPIEGEVRLPNGQPATNVNLQIEPQGMGGVVQSTSTDSGGHFSFTDQAIGPGGNYFITVNGQGYQPIHKLVMVTGPFTYLDINLVRLAGVKPASESVISVKQLQLPPAALEEYNRGLQDMDEGRTTQAEEAFKKAIRIDPKFAASYLRLSAIYADQNRFPAAEEAIHRAFAIDHNKSDTYAYLGYLFMKQKLPEDARQSLEKSIQMAPNHWFAQLELGRLLYHRKDYAGALPHLELAHNLHPQAASVPLLLYDDLIRMNKRKEALAELDDFVARFPGTSEAARMRAVRPALAAAVAGQH